MNLVAGMLGRQQIGLHLIISRLFLWRVIFQPQACGFTSITVIASAAVMGVRHLLSEDEWKSSARVQETQSDFYSLAQQNASRLLDARQQSRSFARVGPY